MAVNPCLHFLDISSCLVQLLDRGDRTMKKQNRTMTESETINLIRSTTDFAMHMVSAYVKPGDTVVDATCGNGHDTLALARMLMQVDSEEFTGRIYAFDVQQQAVAATRELLTECGFSLPLPEGRIELIHDSHENIRQYVPGSCSAIVFNLGYLPGGDKSITTEKESTLSAIRDILGISSTLETGAAPPLLRKDGILCITMYSGHGTGAEEKTRLLELAAQLDAGKYHTSYISMPNQKNNPPEILLISIK